MTPRGWARDLALLTVVVVVLFAGVLPFPPVWAHGEAREGLVVQDVVLRGHWVLPRRNGAIPSKPPLFHWIAGAGARVLGLSDATLRLPSALAAWVMLAGTFALGATLGGRATGWLAVGALAGTATFWTSASEARTDMVFAACVTGTLIAFFYWYRGNGRTARALCYLGAVLGVLAKGPAGAVLPALVIAAFLAVQREIGRLRALWSWGLAAGAAAVVLGWYGAAYRDGGREFLAVQLLKENLDRFVGQGDFHHSRWRAPLRLEGTLATHLLPWNLVLVWALVRRLRGEREDAAGRFLHVWWIGILLFFTLAAGKRSVYLLPLYPAIALLAARALITVTTGDRLFGVLPVPAAVRRRVPARPALALLAGLVLVFDATLLASNQVARVRRGGRHSLVEFARAVRAHVQPDVPLRGGPGLLGTDVWVLSYRLARPIVRDPAPCVEAAYYLMPAAKAASVGTVLVSSRRHGEALALVRCDGVPSPRRASGDGGAGGAAPSRARCDVRPRRLRMAHRTAQEPCRARMA